MSWFQQQYSLTFAIHFNSNAKVDHKKEALESSVLSFWATDIGYLGRWLVTKYPGITGHVASHRHIR